MQGETLGSIEYWKIGTGNAQSLVDTETAQVGYEEITTGEDLITELMNRLNQYRYEDTLLITPDKTTLQKLRRLLVASRDTEASLRGFSHIDVESQLATHFGQDLQDYDLEQSLYQPPRQTETTTVDVVDDGSVQTFWEFWSEFFRLLPAQELTGDQL
jgi:hypothetical protein